MTLTKTQIVDSVQESIGFSRKKSAELIDNVLEIIKRNLEDGDDVLISGFGKFCVKDKKERKGRNPATGDDMVLKKRRVVTFKCSSVLRDSINSNKKKK